MIGHPREVKVRQALVKLLGLHMKWLTSPECEALTQWEQLRVEAEVFDTGSACKFAIREEREAAEGDG